MRATEHIGLLVEPLIIGEQLTKLRETARLSPDYSANHPVVQPQIRSRTSERTAAMKMKLFLIGVALVFPSVLGFAQEATHEAGHAEAMNDSGCALSTATNGQTITVRGKVTRDPHDMVFGIPGCNDTVLLTYAGDSDNDVSADRLRKDENLKQFQNYTSAVYKSKGKNLCLQCTKYGDVEATLTGKLETASMPPGTTKDPSGFLRDPSGNIVGKFGWGHPVPFAKYRLIIQSVSDVKARNLPKPSNTSSANSASQQPVV